MKIRQLIKEGICDYEVECTSYARMWIFLPITDTFNFILQSLVYKSYNVTSL